MVTHIKPMTAEEFVHFTELPENADRIFELISGEMVEVSPARTSNSHLHSMIAGLVLIHCRANNLPCYMTSGDGTYDIAGNVVAPDFSYKPTPMSGEYPDKTPPTWVVEVVSPTDEPRKIRDKRNVYLAAKIVYLEMYPEDKSVDVYRPAIEVQTFGVNDSIDLGDVIAGFKLPLKDVFGA